MKTESDRVLERDQSLQLPNTVVRTRNEVYGEVSRITDEWLHRNVQEAVGTKP